MSVRFPMYLFCNTWIGLWTCPVCLWQSGPRVRLANDVTLFTKLQSPAPGREAACWHLVAAAGRFLHVETKEGGLDHPSISPAKHQQDTRANRSEIITPSSTLRVSNYLHMTLLNDLIAYALFKMVPSVFLKTWTSWSFPGLGINANTGLY